MFQMYQAPRGCIFHNLTWKFFICKLREIFLAQTKKKVKKKPIGFCKIQMTLKFQINFLTFLYSPKTTEHCVFVTNTWKHLTTEKGHLKEIGQEHLQYLTGQGPLQHLKGQGHHLCLTGQGHLQLLINLGHPHQEKDLNQHLNIPMRYSKLY